MKKSILTQNKLSSFFHKVICMIALAMGVAVLVGVQPAFSQVRTKINGTPGSKQNWSVSPYEEKVFVENKGQFDNKNGLESGSPGGGIRYAIRDLGVDIYFTASGLTYKHDEFKELNEEEIKEAYKQTSAGAIDEERVLTKTISHFVHMNWIGANPDAQIVAADAVSDYYTYPDLNDNSGKLCIKAMAYKKITYKNLYPYIDVEYSFPEGKQGIKYALILHSGADVSVIKMQYSSRQIGTSPAQTESASVTAMKLDEAGNVQISTPFGDFVDHAPQTFYQGGGQIKSGFTLSGETVSFKLDDAATNAGQTIIIDPWTKNPAFTAYNAAYDVDYDLAGNVYVYGGGNPWQEVKYNSAGVKQWTYTTSLFYASGCAGPCYGDFAVDGKSGSSYLVEAFNGGNGVRVIKVNQAGAQVGLYTPPNAYMSEMWRVQYNNCTGQAIIAGGGISYEYQACLLDTNVSNLVPVNIMSASTAYHDFALLTLDNDGNCFMASAEKQPEPGILDNLLFKCSASTLFPVAYAVPDSLKFLEVSSVAYIENTKYQANGFNGIAADHNYVYTYNGALLEKWNKNSHILIDSVRIDTIPYEWGGLDVNDCGDVFVGTSNRILKLDANLKVIDTIKVFENIYDLKLGPGNMLYATGLAFVQAISLPVSTCGSLSVSATPDSCGQHGTATVTLTGGVGPFSYIWNNGQTTQTATGLSSGTYTVTVVDSSVTPCSKANGGSYTTVVTVPGGGGGFNAIAGPDTTICPGDLVQLNCPTPGSAYSWSPSTWLTDTTIANPFAFALTSTTYTVTVTQSGCNGTATVTITVFPPTPVPIITESQTAPTDTLFCSTDPAIIAHQWYSHGTLIPGETGIYYIADSSGNYNVVVTDTNGCQISVGTNIIIKSVGIHDLSADNTISFFPNPANDQLTINASSLHLNEPILVSVCDVLGKTVQQERVYWSNATTVSIRSLASGIYFLQLQQPEGGKWIGRFVKE